MSMINICPNCGSWEWNKELSTDGKRLICKSCQYEWNVRRKPLFIITGASGVGKTTTMQYLLQKEHPNYICFEQDILNFMPDSTTEELHTKRETILTIARNAQQSDLPVVINAASIPEQFENTYNRRFFTTIYYVALACDSQALKDRMRNGRNIDNEAWIQSSLDFNQWFFDHGKEHTPPIHVIDITNKTSDVVAHEVDEWIQEILKQLES